MIEEDQFDQRFGEKGISDINLEQLGQTFSTLSAVITTVEGKTEESR